MVGSVRRYFDLGGRPLRRAMRRFIKVNIQILQCSTDTQTEKLLADSVWDWMLRRRVLAPDFGAKPAPNRTGRRRAGHHLITNPGGKGRRSRHQRHCWCPPAGHRRPPAKTGTGRLMSAPRRNLSRPGSLPERSDTAASVAPAASRQHPLTSSLGNRWPPANRPELPAHVTHLNIVKLNET